MSDSPLMLGVSGMRGIVGGSLTPEVVARFSGAFAWFLGGRGRVVLARDGRAGGEAVHAAALAGLLAGGMDVVDIGVAMTPTAAVAGEHVKAAGAVVITASHNPQEWNGVKLIARSPRLAAPGPEAAERIIGRYREGAGALVAWKRVGRVERPGFDPVEVHVARVVERLGALGLVKAIRKAKLRVVADSVNASGAMAMAVLLDRLKVKLVHVGASGTGVFPHLPEPTEENLGGLRRRVRAEGADAGLAQDPDGDRLALVDERGRYIGEEYTLVFSARSLLEAKKGRGERRLATNLSTSRMIDDVAAAHRARVERTPVGEANVVAAIGAGAVMGGEGNGGVIWPAVTMIRDSLSATALTLGLVARTGRSLGELVEEMPRYAIAKRKVPLVRREDAADVLRSLAARHEGRPGTRVDTRDGVRVDRAGEWLHVRPSNTEPILRLIAEAPERSRAEAILDEAAALAGYT